MATGHPTDAQGRVLPECTWPAEKSAPNGVDLIRRFCNTRNIESGADLFETIDGLRGWLDEHCTTAADGEITDSDRRRLVDVREHLRGHAIAHHDDLDGPGSSSFAVPLTPAIVDVSVALDVDGDRLVVRPAGGDVADRAVAELALAVLEAQRRDLWRRFKACPNCGWVFFDRSKNRSGRWCSMNACGGRAKVAAFRERARERAR